MSDQEKNDESFSGFVDEEESEIDNLRRKMYKFIEEFDETQEEILEKIKEDPIKKLEAEVSILKSLFIQSWLTPVATFAIIFSFVSAVGVGIAAFDTLTNRIDKLYDYYSPEQIDKTKNHLEKT